MPEENTDLMQAIERFKNRSYIADIAGRIGVKSEAPTLTNLSDALIVSAHGALSSGFTPDKSATNDLAKIIDKRIESGGDPLTLEEIASTMGSATNDVKRVIIDACFAAGYNFNTVKKLFPNLEQLVAPSTDKPTSGAYLPYLVRQKPSWSQYQTSEISPFFNITPTQTNLIRSAKDWNAPANVTVTLPAKELKLQKELGEYNKAPISTNYYGKYTPTRTEFLRRLAAASKWHKEQLAKPGRRTDKEYEDLLEEVKRMIAAASEE